MRVLVTGANGFIVRASSRRCATPGTKRSAQCAIQPQARAAVVRLRISPRDVEASARLASIDAVVNCAGILRETRMDNSKASMSCTARAVSCLRTVGVPA